MKTKLTTLKHEGELTEDNPFMKKNETQITRIILRKLRENFPGVWYKIHGGPYQEAGIPDIVGCYKGRLCAFEVKTPQKRTNVSLAQQYQIDRLTKAGALVHVVTSWDDVAFFMQNVFGVPK